ncbi:hypothetical protein [Streptomyces massasporeus]
MSAPAARLRDPDRDPGVRPIRTRRTAPSDTGVAVLAGSEQ